MLSFRMALCCAVVEKASYSPKQPPQPAWCSCVPIVLKTLGNTRTDLALGNLPFHHSVNWQAFSFFLLPRSLQQSDQAGATRQPARIKCRREEAAWINARYTNPSLLNRMRRDAVLAFHAHMDVLGNPAGVASAVRMLALPELEHGPGLLYASNATTS